MTKDIHPISPSMLVESSHQKTRSWYNFNFEPVQADHTTSSSNLHGDPGFDDAHTPYSACKSTLPITTDSEIQNSEDISQTSDEQISTSEVTNISSCSEIGSSQHRLSSVNNTVVDESIQCTEIIPFRDEQVELKDHPLDKVLGKKVNKSGMPNFV